MLDSAVTSAMGPRVRPQMWRGAAVERSGADAAAGFELRRLAADLPERMLFARLEMTCAQRGTRKVEVRDTGGGLAVWALQEVWGLSTGFGEGVAVGRADPLHLGLAAAAESGADLFALTSLAGSAPDVVVNRPETVHRGQHWAATQMVRRVREVLPLAPDVEQMLAGLGRHTRRNIRAARRSAEASGMRFRALPDPSCVDAVELSALARRTRPYAIGSKRRARLEAYAEQTGRPFRTELRTASGQLVSYCCGFLDSTATAYLIYQLNDPEWRALSPSLLHRSFLIDWLIRSGFRNLTFVHGCSGVLRNACLPIYLNQFWLMRRSVAGYAGGAAFAVGKRGEPMGQLARIALASALNR